MMLVVMRLLHSDASWYETCPFSCHIVTELSKLMLSVDDNVTDTGIVSLL